MSDQGAEEDRLAPVVPLRSGDVVELDTAGPSDPDPAAYLRSVGPTPEPWLYRPADPADAAERADAIRRQREGLPFTAYQRARLRGWEPARVDEDLTL